MYILYIYISLIQIKLLYLFYIYSYSIMYNSEPSMTDLPICFLSYHSNLHLLLIQFLFSITTPIFFLFLHYYEPLKYCYVYSESNLYLIHHYFLLYLVFTNQSSIPCLYVISDLQTVLFPCFSVQIRAIKKRCFITITNSSIYIIPTFVTTCYLTSLLLLLFYLFPVPTFYISAPFAPN